MSPLHYKKNGYNCLNVFWDVSIHWIGLRYAYQYIENTMVLKRLHLWFIFFPKILNAQN